MNAAEADNKADQKTPWTIAELKMTQRLVENAYTPLKNKIARLAIQRIGRRPIRSASAPPSGAERAEAYVMNPRKRPAVALVPPRERIRKGIVGKSKKAETKVVKVKPQSRKNCLVKSAAFGDSEDFVEQMMTPPFWVSEGLNADFRYCCLQTKVVSRSLGFIGACNKRVMDRSLNEGRLHTGLVKNV